MVQLLPGDSMTMGQDDLKKPATLRDFDYFAEGVPVADLQREAALSHDDDLDELARVARKQRSRRWRTLLITATFFAASVWFAWGYRDLAHYAFAPPEAPLQLGDVKELRPDDIPHNRYVTIHGITEHRGLKQSVARGPAIGTNEYWYFRLLGSRGVFIEVPPDGKQYGYTTEVTVSGRAVDPRLAPVYRNLLAAYEDTFATELQRQSRVIQVGLEPGTGRVPYIIAAAVLLILGALNTLALVHVLKIRRMS